MADNKQINQESSTQEGSVPLPKIFNWASKDGEFKRQVSSFQNTVSASDPDCPFKPEPNRYHLYISYACPWANRTMIVRALKGLEDIISFSVVHYLLGPEGWEFTEDEYPDHLYNAKFLSEIYRKASPDYQGRFTVPVLWDKKLITIVNNESSQIIRILNTEFNKYAKTPELHLYPVHLHDQIEEINHWVYDMINNGVYKSGFATTQEAYENNVVQVIEGLNRVERILSENKFLTGDSFTEADIRLFVTIVRFDPVYHTHFKCNSKTITHDYPSILKWLRRVYQMPRIASTINMEHIKKHYYMSHIQINPYRVVPVWEGPDLTVKVDD